ncbi:MAG: glycosyltransferase family 4 protein [Blastocatellia bacterium]
MRERERALVRKYPLIDLEVVTARRWNEGSKNVQAANDELFRVIAAETWPVEHVTSFAYNPFTIIDALRNHRPHLIDIHQEPYSLASAQILATASLIVPDATVIVFTAQNILKRYPPPFSMFEQYAYAKAAAIYPCSTSVLEVVRAKAFHKPCPIIPFGVDISAFQQRSAWPSPDATPTIGYVGRMVQPKGILLLARALRQLKDLDWKLLLIGDGPDLPLLMQELGESGLLDRTTSVGSVDYNSIPGYFRQMDLMIMPTITTNRVREQFGRVLVEAMASGVCVAGSTCGAIPEVIGDAGVVFPENDETALAAKIRPLLLDGNLRERYARMGRARVEQHFTWDKVAEQTYKLYCQVLGLHQPSRTRKWEAAPAVCY